MAADQRKDSPLKEPHAPPLPLAVFQIPVALADQDCHSQAIMQNVAARTDGRMILSPGTLDGAIERLPDDGLIIELRQPPADDGQRRRSCRLTT
ncbi:MAG TPA: hypothetical protein VMF13_01500 [Luteitalea sp.]|nr:hypothetical protein [Luteitalea sp.]